MLGPAGRFTCVHLTLVPLELSRSKHLDHSEFLNLANFPVPDELSSDEEGGGEKGSEQGSEEGSEKGGEQESEDSEEDVPLAQRKIARE